VVFLNYVLKVSDEAVVRIISFYRDYQKESSQPSVVFFAKTDFVSVTVYQSNKVMFQGSDAYPEYQMWTSLLHLEPEEEKPKKPKTKETIKDYYKISIGSDEVGTGDYFGPITVCAVYVDKDLGKKLYAMNIRDSKTLTDEAIIKTVDQLKDQVNYSLLTLHNARYNELVDRGFNLNKIKAYLHNKAILNLKQKITGNPDIIVDQFTEEKLYYRYLSDEQEVVKGIHFTTKGESKFASIALASMFARYAFVKHFDRLSEECGYPLVKGASAKVDELAAQIIEDKGKDFLNNIAKMHFKTTQKAEQLILEKSHHFN
jgi:ribonuclease HIII